MVVQEGWKTTTIGEMIQVKEVTMQTGPFGTVLSASEYTKHGIPVISVREIRQGHIELFEETPFVSGETYRKMPQFNLLAGDLVFARKGSIDRSALIPFNGKQYFLGSDGIRLRFKNLELSRIILYILQLEETKQFLLSNAYGTTMAGLNEEIISQIPVSYPIDENEQKEIATALCDTDVLIENLREMIAKKKNIKQGAIHRLLSGKERLVDHSKQWVYFTFKECFDVISNNTLSRADLNYISGTVKNIHYGDVLIKFSEILDCKHEDLPFVNEGVKINTSVLRDGDVLLSDTAEDETVGKATEIINMGNQRVVAGLHTIPCRPKKSDMFAPMWLGYYMNSTYFHDQIIPLITGIKVSSISKTALSDTIIAVPEKREQEQIVKILYEMDLEIESLQRKLEKYLSIRAGMMDELLTGKIRLM